MNENNTHSDKKTRRLLIARLMLIATLGITTVNSAHASHGYYDDASALSFSISYGYYPEAVVYYDSYRPVHRYRHVDNHRYYAVRPGRHGWRGHKHGHKHHRNGYRGHHRH